MHTVFLKKDNVDIRHKGIIVPFSEILNEVQADWKIEDTLIKVDGIKETYTF